MHCKHSMDRTEVNKVFMCALAVYCVYMTAESSRFSLRPSKKLHAGLIGLPQNDLRHIGHVGYDGAVFGDVSFIGDNYSKLPVKVGSTQAFQGGLSFRFADGLPVNDVFSNCSILSAYLCSCMSRKHTNLCFPDSSQ